MIRYSVELRWPLTILVLVVGLFVGPVDAKSLPDGRYFSSLAGTMYFICRGYDSCEVTYDGQGKQGISRRGKIIGRHSLSGQFVGTWIQQESKVNCDKPYKGSYNWGTVNFHFNDSSDAWEGYWTYCNNRSSLSWNGRRTKYW